MEPPNFSCQPLAIGYQLSGFPHFGRLARVENRGETLRGLPFDGESDSVRFALPELRAGCAERKIIAASGERR
ncbi:MAG: hypothetical protein H0U65_13920 [Rubrobacter sp.]|jgi:hypothetical protein|nr:hypothetical protein [Rubrobacter sp.]